MTHPTRGQIYLVRFDPTIGHEIQKTRPALIIQNDIGNKFSHITIVADITSKLSPVPYPVEVSLSPTKQNGLTAPSSIHLDQIRSVDKKRLVKLLGKVDAQTLSSVDGAIKVSLGLISL